jgi:hypothetical protein
MFISLGRNPGILFDEPRLKRFFSVMMGGVE